MQARQQLAPPASGPRGMTLQHALITARSRVLSNPGVDGLRAFVAEAESPSLSTLTPVKQASALYAGILSDSRLKDNRLGSRLVPRLLALTAQDPAASRLAKLLDAEVALATGDAQRALADADPSSKHRPEVLLGDQALLQLSRPKEAVQRLQTWVASHPRDATAWQMLARGYSAEGEALRSVHAEAEAQVALMDYSAALDRFKAAQDLSRRSTSRSDHIEASIIDTRARQVESLLREQALER
jgi:predicted Zn-dependent protease